MADLKFAITQKKTILNERKNASSIIAADRSKAEKIQAVKNSPTPIEIAQEIPAPFFTFWGPEQPYYFHSGELSEKPHVAYDSTSDLNLALTSDLAKSALLRLQINEHGEVDQVIIDHSNFSEAEQRLLIASFSKMKFQPGKIADIPVKSEMRIEVMTEKTAPIAKPIDIK